MGSKAMVTQEKFDKAVEELSDYVEELQRKFGLTDEEIRAILDIVRYDYV
jgi:DNA-binding transcriptional regulator YhcF (GntR family)